MLYRRTIPEKLVAIIKATCNGVKRMRCINSWRKHSPPETFLFASGNFLHIILPGRYGEIQSTMLSLFKHLDYGNDICLLCYRVIDLHQIALDVEKGSNVGQEITKLSVSQIITLFLFAGMSRTSRALNYLCLDSVAVFNGGTELHVA